MRNSGLFGRDDYRPTGLTGFVSRNRLWLIPLTVAAYAAFFPWLLAKTGDSIPVPPWVWPTLQIAGCFGAALAAKFTDTASADIIQVVGLVLAFVAVLWLVL